MNADGNNKSLARARVDLSKTWTALGAAWLLAAALAGPGARNSRADDAPPANEVTFARDIAPMINSKCAECHRPGEIAPMSLLTYEEVRPWVKSIKAEVAAKRMPPWHADPIGHEYLGDTSLSEREIASFTRWVDAGAPLGDPALAPPAPKFEAGWKLGPPDQVFEMPEAYEVPAEGADNYWCFVLPPMEADVWLKGAEARPGNRNVAHHVGLFLDGGGQQSARLDEKTPGPGYPCYGAPGFMATDIFGVWAPGMTPEYLPEGVARPLPKGSRIVMQMHYHSNGMKETDKTSIALYYAKEPIRKKVNLGIVGDFGLFIRPGDADYVSSSEWIMPHNAQALSVFPHMHVLGKLITVGAETPDKQTIPLVSVSRYDFNWQRNYEFKTPIDLPEGTVVKLEARFDNSEANPNNPHKPPKPVRFGMGTNDEMSLAFVTFTYADEDRVRDNLPFPTEGTLVMDKPKTRGPAPGAAPAASAPAPAPAAGSAGGR